MGVFSKQSIWQHKRDPLVFSGFGIVSQSSQCTSLIQRLVQRHEVSNEKSYCARLYYRRCDIHDSWEVYFAIMRNLELYIAVSYLVYLHKVAIYIPPLQAVDGGYAKMDAS